MFQCLWTRSKGCTLSQSVIVYRWGSSVSFHAQIVSSEIAEPQSTPAVSTFYYVDEFASFLVRGFEPGLIYLLQSCPAEETGNFQVYL